MTGGKPGLGDMAVLAALALSQEFFSDPAPDGRLLVPFSQAHVLISGRVDTWDTWRDLEPTAKALIGRLLRVRHNELASLHRFLDAARRVCASPDSPFVIPAGVAPHEAAEVIALHGQEPLAFAGQMIAAMEAEHARDRVPIPAAAPSGSTLSHADSTPTSSRSGTRPRRISATPPTSRLALRLSRRRLRTRSERRRRKSTVPAGAIAR